ncbi:MAG: DUF819 family protein [Pseudomonadota bacterium]
MIADSMTLAVALVGIAAGVYAASSLSSLGWLFRYFPPVVWMYFVPMLLSTAGVLPAEHPLYASLARYALPMALILLTVSTDLRAVASVGVSALLSLAIGALGVGAGCVLAYLLFSPWLGDDAWQAFAMLSATWIGGSANMVAMQQSLGVPASYIGPIVVVDTVIAYSWLGLLIAVAAQQPFLNRFLNADMSRLDSVEAQLRESSAHAKPATVNSICMILGFSLVGSFLARVFAENLPELGSPRIITATTWTILITVSLGLLLSGSRLGQLARQHRASEYAYAALFLLLVSVGAQADLRAVGEAPVFLFAGALVLLVHVACLLLACRLLRLPAFFVAVGSMANVGGAVSGPIAASAYRPALAPVGALLGVAGYILGIYLPLGIAFVLSVFAS